jgi:hypothetical protein
MNCREQAVRWQERLRRCVKNCSQQIELSGINFVLTRFAFGDLAFADSKRSVSLFASDVMPWILEHTDAFQPH